MGGCGQVKFYPYKKGDGKRFTHAEGGGHTRFGDSFNTIA